MQRNGPFGRVTSSGLTARSGDVDNDGEIVDALTRRLRPVEDELVARLRRALPTESPVSPLAQAELVAGVLRDRGIR